MRTKMGHAVYRFGEWTLVLKSSARSKEPEEVLRFDPWEAYGQQDRRKLTATSRITIGRSATMIRCSQYDRYLRTCVSGLIEIFGWEMLLLTVGLDPEGFGEVANDAHHGYSSISMLSEMRMFLWSWFMMT